MTTTKEELKPSDVLEHAANLIDEWGWARKNFVGINGAMCHLGAIRAATGWHVHGFKKGGWRIVDHDLSRAVERLTLAAQEYDMQALGVTSITRWNDEVCKSKAEAVAKLREAAALARSEGR